MKFIYRLLIISLFFGCSTAHKLPEKKYSQNVIRAHQIKKGDTIQISLSNSISTSLRFNFISSDPNYQTALDQIGTIYLKAHADTIISKTYVSAQLPPINFKVYYGDDRKPVQDIAFALPFKNSKSYKIIQGYNGDFSHNDAKSKYAIDFGLKIGDTVCAADDGIVVGVVKNYSKNGNTKEWTDFANFITIYHAHGNLYTQYVHLQYNGAFVNVGDTIKRHQAIGTIGLTGFTTVAHLHFNVLKPVKGDWESTPITFEDGYMGNSLRKGLWIRKSPNRIL